MLAEHPVLRLQVLDDILLAAIHPSGEDQDRELEMPPVHLHQRTPARALVTGLKATTEPHFGIPKSLTFRVG